MLNKRNRRISKVVTYVLLVFFSFVLYFSVYLDADFCIETQDGNSYSNTYFSDSGTYIGKFPQSVGRCRIFELY